MSFSVGTDAYARHVGRYGSALSAAHANAAGVALGDHALDVGCGPGVLLRELARRLGSDHVAGVDPSEPFAETARATVFEEEHRAALREACFRRLGSPEAAFSLTARAWFVRGELA